mgnify:CR=1 FL=1
MLEYTVGKEKGSSRYFVCRAGDNTPLTHLYSTKKKALHAAANFEGMDYKEYMKIYRKEGADSD